MSSPHRVPVSQPRLHQRPQSQAPRQQQLPGLAQLRPLKKTATRSTETSTTFASFCLLLTLTRHNGSSRICDMQFESKSPNGDGPSHFTLTDHLNDGSTRHVRPPTRITR